MTRCVPRDCYTPADVGVCPAQDYYTVRCLGNTIRDYWEPAEDPDGVLRDRLAEQERLAYLENVADELDHVRLMEPGRIVDCGCGPGWFLRELPRWWRFGVEVSVDACAELDRHKIPHGETCDGIASGSVDVVTCLHVIEHLRDPVKAVRDIRRILRPGGTLIISTPDFASPCARRFGPNYRMLHDRTHCSLFTNESVHRMLRDYDFRIDDLQFPFPEKYQAQATWERWNDTSRVSPPWPGNWMTFYCTKTDGQ